MKLLLIPKIDFIDSLSLSRSLAAAVQVHVHHVPIILPPTTPPPRGAGGGDGIITIILLSPKTRWKGQRDIEGS